MGAPRGTVRPPFAALTSVIPVLALLGLVLAGLPYPTIGERPAGGATPTPTNGSGGPARDHPGGVATEGLPARLTVGRPVIVPTGSGGATDGSYLLQQVPAGYPPWVGSQPSNVTLDPATGQMYVTDFGGPPAGNAVTIFDASNGTVVANVRAGDDPIASTYDPSDGFVYVMNYGLTANVSVFHGTKLVATIPVGLHPRAAVYDPRNGFVYVANEGAANVTVLNGTTIVATIPVGSNPTSAQVDPVTGVVAVPNFGSNNVTLINGTRIAATLAVGGAPVSIAYDPSRATFDVVDSGSGSVSMIQGARVVANVSVGAGALFAAYDRSNGYLYVPVQGSNSVAVINNTTVVANVPAGNGSRNPCYDAVTGLVYVANWGGGSVTVINGTTVRATVAVGTAPYDVTCDDVNGRAYVPVFDTANVSVLGDLRSPYAVSFTESGLSPGTAWGATVGPTTFDGAGGTITIPEANGSYAYGIPPVPGYVTYLAPGNVTLAGTSPIISVPFHRTYAVTFNESGLSYAHSWTVTLNGSATTTIGTSILFAAPNGTFAYAITPIPGYRAPIWSGQVQVAGTPVNLSVPFVADLYDVQFTECCLPSPVAWSVVLNGTRANSTTATIHFAETNGTYTYAFPPVSGFRTPAGGQLKVTAHAVAVNVTFAPLTYPVNFSQTGLPAGTRWSIAIEGANYSSTNTSFEVPEPNGSYTYVVDPVAGYVSNRSGGTVDVRGEIERVAVSFTALAYSVAFDESGLPNGTSWTVTLGGQRQTASVAEILFTEGPGSYSYSVQPVPGYDAVPSGSLDASASVHVPVPFTPFDYAVAFGENGLPQGFLWNVTVAGATWSSSSASLNVSLANGTHPYRIEPIPGYSTTWVGLVDVRGASAAVPVAFVRVVYAVGFTASGLPNGTIWSVTLGSSTQNSTGPSIVFREPNGSYPYAVGDVDGYQPVAGGSVSVQGSAPLGVDLEFQVVPPSKGSPGTAAWPTLASVGAIAGLGAVAVAVFALRRRRAPPSEPVD